MFSIQCVSCSLQHTQVLGPGCDLGQELDEVGQVVSEELGADDEVFARVGGLELGAEQLRLSLDAEGGTSLGALLRQC